MPPPFLDGIIIFDKRAVFLSFSVQICPKQYRSLYDSSIPELRQHLQHVNTNLLRIIIQTGADDAEPIRSQYPAMQLVGLVLLVPLIVFIGYLLHGNLPSSSQTETYHPETAHLSDLPHSDQDDDY